MNHRKRMRRMLVPALIILMLFIVPLVSASASLAQEPPEFIDFISDILAIAGQLVADWPVLVAVTAFMPAIVNLLKWVSAFIPAWNFDGSSSLVNFILGTVIFVGLFVARAVGIDMAGIDSALLSIATLITSFLSLVGFQLLSKRVGLPLAKKLPGALSHSYSEGWAGIRDGVYTPPVPP